MCALARGASATTGAPAFVLPASDPFLLRARRAGRLFEREISPSAGEVELTLRLE